MVEISMIKKFNLNLAVFITLINSIIHNLTAIDVHFEIHVNFLQAFLCACPDPMSLPNFGKNRGVTRA